MASLDGEDAIALLCHLSSFEDVLITSYLNLEPSHLVHYLFELRYEMNILLII